MFSPCPWIGVAQGLEMNGKTNTEMRKFDCSNKGSVLGELI